MSKRKKVEETAEIPGPVPGTVEFERKQHFEKEKAAYEARTGEKVSYELDAPLTSTPIAEEADEGVRTPSEPADDAEGEGDQ